MRTIIFIILFLGAWVALDWLAMVTAPVTGPLTILLVLFYLVRLMIKLGKEN
jgi:hypothetical protein